MKRIALFFDGTWNTPEEPEIPNDAETNVMRLYRAIKGKRLVRVPGKSTRKPPTIPTILWYDKGVGTKWYEHVRGGAFGFGLSRNIREGYKTLADNYEPGDEVYVFGFSRGAYTARSLIGFIRNVGILKKEHLKKPDPDENPHLVEAYDLYRQRDEGADTPFSEQFRKNFSYKQMPDIRALGVWDTVGALGVPLKVLELFSAKRYEFHDTRLSGIVANAFHALAVDEHREDYKATLWDPVRKPQQRIEQVWFSGAHADVGGGYPNQSLSDLTLKWMSDAAELHGDGLEVDPSFIPGISESTIRARINDSFADFLKGIYALFKDRYYRPIAATLYGNETVDQSVSDKEKLDTSYRPRNPGLASALLGHSE